MVRSECNPSWLLSRTVTVQANPVLSLRSGEPGELSSAAFAQLLTAGSEITGLEFRYQYLAGYGPTGVGANFSLAVAGQRVYDSPPLTNYTNSANQSGYSPSVVVSLRGLSIHVPHGPSLERIEIAFRNNGRNVQLKLPLEVNVSCSASGVDFGAGPGGCAAPPLPEPIRDELHVLLCPLTGATTLSAPENCDVTQRTTVGSPEATMPS